MKRLTGDNDTALNFEYKYDSTAGSGATVYVIGVFLRLTIQRAPAYRTQQTPVSSPITPPSKDVPHGG